MLLPHEPIKERFGKDWRTTAVGKRIRVRGTLHVHKCGPEEQCLISGEIPILTPESIELLDPPATPSAAEAPGPRASSPLDD